jgi:hypothetical protein
MNAEIIVSNTKFSQSYLKISAKTTWQFSRDGKTTQEVNVAEETLYFKMAGESDVWFSTRNVQASGLKNELVQEKLQDVQSVCDSIEQNFYRLNFAGVQQAIRTLQHTINILKSTIDEVTAANPSYKVKVAFIGLPSDNPYQDMLAFGAIKDSWTVQETLTKDQQLKMGQLPAASTPASTDQLVKTIAPYADWQDKLPENTFMLLGRYIAGFNPETARIPENVHSVAKEKTVTDYPQTVTDFKDFLEQRVLQIPGEIQIIGATQNKLQAVKLFDGMLRSYLSSIYWGEWKNTRQ